MSEYRRRVASASRIPTRSTPCHMTERQIRQVTYTGLRRLSLVSPTYGNVCRRRHSMNAADQACVGEGGIANRPRSRRASLSGEDDEDFDFLAELKEQALLPIKEDLADWLAKTLDIDINVDNFVDVLDNGVDVCRLAAIIQKKAEQAKDRNEYKGLVPGSSIHYKKQAQAGSWFARDNTANFIRWCRDFGVKEECLFETEGLVLHKEPRSVVLCLLELARLGAKVGLEPPNLVRLENEIEREECGSNSSGSTQSLPCMSSNSGMRNGHQGAVKSRRKGSSSSASAISSVKADKLDTEVRRVVGKCNCPNKYTVNRITEGKYMVGGKSMFVRLLKDRHVMVRVGGGWDTLVHYLLTHDPCKITEFKRQLASGDGAYLHIRGKYKA